MNIESESVNLAIPFEQMAKVIDDVMWITDIEMKKILFVNSAYEKVWGVSCEELYNNPMSFLEAIHSSDRERVRAALLTHSCGAYDETYKIVRPDGSTKWIHDRSYSPTQMQNGSWCVMRLARDVTSHKIAEETQKNSEARFRSMIDGAPIPLAINSDAAEITYLNSAFIECFGYTRDDIPTLNDWWPLAYPDLEYRQWISKTWQLEVQNSKLTGNSFNPIEAIIRCKDGTQKTVLASAAPLLNGFNVDHLVVLCDITNLKKTESEKEELRIQLMQASKMASLGELAAGVAHEINNPLGIVEGAAGQLNRFKDAPEKFNAKIDVIQKACLRMSTIVGGLKKFSRSTDGLTFKKVTLSEIANEAVLLSSIRAKRFDVQIVIDFNCQAIILADSVSIEQVIINLISNGIDAVKQLDKKWVRLEITDDSKFVIMRVSDSGPGIPEKLKDKIFEPFFTTKAIGEGTGLGLSISRGIIADHNGTIELVSDSLSTCFEIRFLKVEGKDAD